MNLPNHTHLMWQVDYTFSGGILTHAVFGEDTNAIKLVNFHSVSITYQPSFKMEVTVYYTLSHNNLAFFLGTLF